MQLSALRNETDRDRQARRLHGALTDLVRHYQFRDRNEICCHGVSVAQCYALESLGARDGLTMGELAASQRVAVSTMTRVVDQLVSRGLVDRRADVADRRVLRVFLTGEGRRLLSILTGELVRAEAAILARIPEDHRDSVLAAVEALRDALAACCGPAGNNCKGECNV